MSETKKNAPKEPQDHKPKKVATMTVTVQGFTLTIDPDVFDDLDVLDTLDQINEGNPLRTAGLLRKLTGDQYDAARDALRDPDTGRIPIKVATDFFTEIMKALNPNSSSS